MRVTLLFLLIFVISTVSFAETINFGTKLVFSGATGPQMFSNLDLTGTDVRASSFGDGIDRVVGSTVFSGITGTDGVFFTSGATAGTSSGTPNTGNAGLDGVLSAGIHLGPSIDVTATVGDLYQVQLLFFADFVPDRRFDITVDGVLFADDFTVEINPNHDQIIYRFDVTADSNGIDIDITDGPADPHGNPFVQGIVVENVTDVVPEPATYLLSIIALLALGIRKK